MSDCKAFRTEIDEALSAAALGRDASAHASLCAACADALREREALRGLVRGLVRVEAPHDFEFRLRARMAATKPRGGLALFGRLRSPGLAWVAAAVCFLAVSATLYMRQSPKRVTAPVAEPASIAVAPRNADESKRVDAEASRPDAEASRRSDGVGSTLVAGRVDAPTSTHGKAAPHVASSKRDATQARWSDFIARGPRGDAPRPGSFDLASKSARVIKHLPETGGVASRAQGIQLGTSAGTLRVVLRDERGVVVPMRRVSFGSQEALVRETASRREPASEEEGVW
jgi:hypothetical protein